MDIEPESLVQFDPGSCNVLPDQNRASSEEESLIQNNAQSSESMSQLDLPPHGDPRLESLATYSQFYQRQMVKNYGTNRLRQVLCCLLCEGFNTSKATHMRDHIRSHLSLKPFKCEICGRGFNRKGN